MDLRCGLRVGMNFIDGVNRGDKLTLFTFSHYTQLRIKIFNPSNRSEGLGVFRRQSWLSALLPPPPFFLSLSILLPTNEASPPVSDAECHRRNRLTVSPEFKKERWVEDHPSPAIRIYTLKKRLHQKRSKKRARLNIIRHPLYASAL